MKRHDKTPYEILRERILDINYFYVFGLTVFIHNQKDHLGKVDANADDGYFLGYSFVTKAFCIFNTRRQQIEETCHVTFDESMEAIRFTNTSVGEIGIDDSSRYPPDEFFSQEEGIEYDETFSLYARMEAIRIFHAFSTYMNFKVFQMDVKSDFLNGKLKEEVYIKQPPGFESSKFSNYVCKLDKALYGLKQAPRAWPDIQLSTCLCARYHANPKESHLIVVKRILMYLKGPPSLGKWYPKCSGFDLKGYLDSDYVVATWIEKVPQKGKKKTKTVTQPKPKSQGPKASRAPPQKRKKVQDQNDHPCSEHSQTGQEESSIGGHWDFLPQLMRTFVNHHFCLRQNRLIPKTKREIKKLADMGLLSTHSDEDPDHNKGKSSSEVKSDTKPMLLTTIADIQTLLGDFEDELKNEREEQPTENPSNKSSKEPSLEPSPKAPKKSKKSKKIRVRISRTVPSPEEDPEFNQRLLKADEGCMQNSTRLTEIPNSLREINFPSLQARITAVENSQVTIHADISSIKQMLMQLLGGENLEKHVIVWKKPPSYTKGEPQLMVTGEPEPKVTKDAKVVDVENDPHGTPKPDRGKGIARDTDESPRNLVPASKEVRQDLDAQAHMELEERKEKDYSEAKLLVLSKTELIKVVTEVATEAEVDPKGLQSSKGGQEFIKKKDVEMKVLKRERLEKLTKAKELKKKRINQYRWTTTNICKPETITDILIHPNTKLVAIIVYRGNDRRNFEVHNPFRFGDFGINEWDELGEIVSKKKNKVVGELMTSLGKKYDRLKVIPRKTGINPSFPSCEQVPGLSSGRKRKEQELEHEVRILGLECNRSHPEGIPFVNNQVIEHPENGIFFIDAFCNTPK
ncbi:retrovirus-related pol polyprotein from transposon TNT 1-94 [Tanacetum coccineum]